MTMTCLDARARARLAALSVARATGRLPAGFQGQFRPILAALAAVAVTWSIWTIPTGLSDDARISIIVLALAIIGWTMTRLGDTAIALVACMALVAAGVVGQDDLHGALGNELIWLLVGAFVLAAVLKQSGLTEALAFTLLRRVTGVRALFHGVSLLLIATALFVPSTSGRAALAVPVFLALADRLEDRALVRALALLFPTIILLSAGGSLIGAGAHLIAIDFMRMLGGQRIDYLGWLALGLPLALVVCFGATEIILRLFLSADQRAQSLETHALPSRSFALRDGLLIAIILVTVALWMTTAWHGASIALVTMAAALVATAPGISSVSLKKAVKSVEWDLLLFMAATLLIGEALLTTNAEEWAARRLVMLIGGSGAPSVALIVSCVIVLSLAAHLVITSRTARVAVLIPTLVIPLSGLGVDPAALILICVMGTGFCQTLPASAKPVALYADLERETYSGVDLLRLSLTLAPLMAGTLAVFAFVVWPAMGLSPWR
jgi:anion transporter